MKKLACLHAHHSNIEYIDRVLQSFGIEILHFVGCENEYYFDKHFEVMKELHEDDFEGDELRL
ncbi:hypothetical protein [Bacillus cereus]|uniref:hypothetical protein n=1 Tax=Bacillus cereus TaxID=1396 RepID=UPI002111817D|nr:hypothetical protein [Bacillus cereus]